MKKIFHPIAIALAAILAVVVGVSLKGTGSRESVQPGPAVERTRTRDAGFRMTVAGHPVKDPAQALRSIFNLPEGERLPWEMRLAHEWGRRDFPAARGWVMTSGPSPRHDLLGALGRAGITSRPLDVMKLADEFADDRARTSFLATMVQTWASTDPASAAAWVEQCEPSVKGEIQNALVIEMAQKDPWEAARYVATDMEPGSAQDQAALTVAGRWATLDPEAANAWALSLSESDLQQRVLAAVECLSVR